MTEAVANDPGLLVPVVTGAVADVAAGDVAVALPSPELAGHAIGCFCCAPRGALGRELGRLFSARARGEVAFFRRVVVLAPPDSAGDVAAQIAADPVAAARYRFASAC